MERTTLLWHLRPFADLGKPPQQGPASFRTCLSPMALAWFRFCDSPTCGYCSGYPYFAPSFQRRYGCYQIVLIFISKGLAHARWLRGIVGDRKAGPQSVDRPVVKDNHHWPHVMILKNSVWGISLDWLGYTSSRTSTWHSGTSFP